MPLSASHILNSISVMAMMTALSSVAKALDEMVHFGNVKTHFPEESFRRAIAAVQKEHDPSCVLQPDEIDMMCELGRLCHKLGNLPEVIDYHKRAAKFRSIMEHRFNMTPDSDSQP